MILSLELLPKISHPTSWASIVLLVQVILVAFFRFKEAHVFLFNKNYILGFNPDFSQQRSEILKPNILFVVMMSQLLWAFIINHFYDLEFSNYLLLSFAFCIWFMLKFSSIYFLGYLFDRQEKAYAVLTFQVINEFCFYIPLLMISLLLHFTATRLLGIEFPSHILGMILYVLIRLRTGFQIFSRLNLRPYYIFLYLCALDMLPLLWVYYWF